MARITGTYERTSTAGEEVAAFVPLPLPPREPPLVLEGGLGELNARAEASLARLDLAGAMVPSLKWFLYSFVRKEAVLTSQIEGTQATLMDLLSFEASRGSEDEPARDLLEVCNYLDALSYARGQLSDPRGLPLSMRLLAETHRHLMRGVRGGDKRPGEIRQSQNWIGGTRPGNAAFVPPPPHLLADLLGELECFFHAEHGIPPLIHAGLVHVQFETIHPFLDDNGRLGRLLIALLLEQGKVLGQPILYLSLFFKVHRAEYYRRLHAVRIEGDFESWLAFFLEGVAQVAEEAVIATRDLFDLITTDRGKVQSQKGATVMAARLFELLPESPMVTISGVTRLLSTTKPSASKAVSALVGAGVLGETTGRRRDRLFGYVAYLDRLRQGTE